MMKNTCWRCEKDFPVEGMADTRTICPECGGCQQYCGQEKECHSCNEVGSYPKKFYLVVGGNPFTPYTGTTTFTGLRKLGIFSTKEEVLACVEEHYDVCGGLIQAFRIEPPEMK